MPNIATMCWVSSRLMLNIVTMLLVSRWCNGELLCVVVLNGGYDRLNKLEEDKHVWVNLQLPTILLNHCHNLLHHLGRERREREYIVLDVSLTSLMCMVSAPSVVSSNYNIDWPQHVCMDGQRALGEGAGGDAAQGSLSCLNGPIYNGNLIQNITYRQTLHLNIICSLGWHPHTSHPQWEGVGFHHSQIARGGECGTGCRRWCSGHRYEWSVYLSHPHLLLVA